MQLNDKHRKYWRRNLRVTAMLLAIWFVVTFGVAFYARELSQFHFFGWTFSFWMAAQGSVIVYVIITWYYARKMNALDMAYGVDEAAGE